jgi:hypothetical protein
MYETDLTRGEPIAQFLFDCEVLAARLGRLDHVLWSERLSVRVFVPTGIPERMVRCFQSVDTRVDRTERKHSSERVLSGLLGRLDGIRS